MTKPRVLFAGTPAFALASLKALVEGGHVPVAVLTQSDRPAGRGKKMRASIVKEYAVEQNIPILQPVTLRCDAAQSQIAAFAPDIIIVAAYGLILPQSVLDIPLKGCLNVHASLLPRWRGAAPIQAAILAGDRRTGISLMSMTAGLDSGPVFTMAAIDIGEQETAGELQQRLAILGGQTLLRNLAGILGGDLVAHEQDASKASYAAKFSTSDARIDWSLAASELARRVRAYNPVPGAWFMHGKERIKCWRASIGEGRGTPGTVLSASRSGLVVGCGDGALLLTELQRPGKRTGDAAAFVGQRELVGQSFG